MIKRLATHMMFLVVLGLASMSVAQAQTPFSTNFDHFTTGWPLEGTHRNVDCSRCHTAGI